LLLRIAAIGRPLTTAHNLTNLAGTRRQPRCDCGLHRLHAAFSARLAAQMKAMPTETTGRPLLPQTTQMQQFTFAPPALAPRENQRSESLHRCTPVKLTN
jgi:hypothetical protein